jgi:hypothetical protein
LIVEEKAIIEAGRTQKNRRTLHRRSVTVTWDRLPWFWRSPYTFEGSPWAIELFIKDLVGIIQLGILRVLIWRFL